MDFEFQKKKERAEIYVSRRLFCGGNFFSKKFVKTFYFTMEPNARWSKLGVFLKQKKKRKKNWQYNQALKIMDLMVFNEKHEKTMEQ